VTVLTGFAGAAADVFVREDWGGFALVAKGGLVAGAGVLLV